MLKTQNVGSEWLMRLRNRHFFLFDVVVFLLTPALALLLRMDGDVPWDVYGRTLLPLTCAFLLVKLGVFKVLGLYRHYWRFASIDELSKFVVAMGLTIFAEYLVLLGLTATDWLVVPQLPRSLPILDGALAVMLAGGARYSIRMMQRVEQQLAQNGASETRRALIAGAGDSGFMIVREMQNNPHLRMQPVAFVDDDPDKHQMHIHGVTVLGDRSDIPALVRQTEADLVVIAMSKAPGKDIREIVALCEEAGVQVQAIPGVYELLGGEVSVSQLRPVQVEDLLRRPPVETDPQPVDELLRGARVLVTGGGGSIGSELCRQVLRCAPAELVLLGHGENSIFLIEAELRRMLKKQGIAGRVRLCSVIADIRDADRLDQVFRAHRPEVVFHAAAHKHVPLMEANCTDAVSNNVLGTRTLLEAAVRHDVERLVMISTDKAVNPTSVMGTTKRIAELLVHETAERTGRSFVAVRFGNVLDSRGSVVQVFRRQIAQGGPVTVTHPEVKRYFMTIPEAVQLVLQAGAMGRDGEVFALDMGEPVKIIDLARDLIRLSQPRGARAIDIEVTGLRPGEKLFEEIFSDAEAFERTEHEKIFVCRYAGEADCAAWSEVRRRDLREGIDALAGAARRGDEAAVRALLKDLVPSFQPPGRTGDGAPGAGAHMPTGGRGGVATGGRADGRAAAGSSGLRRLASQAPAPKPSTPAPDAGA